MVIHCCWVYPCATKKNLSKKKSTTGDHVEDKGYDDKSRWTFHVPNWQSVNLVKLPDTIQGSSKGRVRWVMLLAIFWGVKGVAGAKSWWYWLMVQKSCPTCWCIGQVILFRHFVQSGWIAEISEASPAGFGAPLLMAIWHLQKPPKAWWKVVNCTELMV